MIDMVNLAAALDDEQRTEIARRVIEEYEADYDSGAEWRDMHAGWVNQYFQRETPMNPPWDGASSESIPMLAEGCNQFHARAVKAFFSGPSFVAVRPTGHVDDLTLKRAERVATHLNWQLMVRDENYRRDKDSLLLATPLHGSMFTKTWFDPLTKRPSIKNVLPTDLVVDYGLGPRSLDDLERKTHVLYVSGLRSLQYVADGYFIEPGVPHIGDNDPVKNAQNEGEGFQAGTRGDLLPSKLLEQHRWLDLTSDGIPKPYIAIVDLTSQKLLRLQARYTIKDGAVVPVEYFTQYDYIPNPDGFYGLGLGHMVGQINTGANKLLREIIDAGELATAGNMSGFISEALSLPGGEMEMTLGQMRKVRNTVGSIKDGIFTFNFMGPNQALLSSLQLLMQRGDRLQMVTEALTGTSDKVMQPTALLALIEQGLEPFAAIYQRMLSSASLELRKVYRLNSMYLDEREYYAVQDQYGAYKQADIARTDYADDLQVMPAADPKQATEQQRMARAEAELQFARTSPIVSQNPDLLMRFERRFLEAIGTRDIDAIYPTPSVPVRIDDQRMENFALLMVPPTISEVFPDQDHLAHLQEIDAFLNDELYGPRLGPDALNMLMTHRSKHVAYMYASTETPMMEIAGAPGPSLIGTPGAGALVPPPRNAMVSAPVAGPAPGGGGGAQNGGGAGPAISRPGSSVGVGPSVQ